jgi:hypothetical protein
VLPGQALPDDLSDGGPDDDLDDEVGERRAASELSSPNPHSVFADDDDSDDDDGNEDNNDDDGDDDGDGAAADDAGDELHVVEPDGQAAAAAAPAAAQGRGGERGGTAGSGRGGAGGAAPRQGDRPKPPNLAALTPGSRLWEQGAICIALELHASGSAKASVAGRRIVSIAAQRVLVDDGSNGSFSSRRATPMASTSAPRGRRSSAARRGWRHAPVPRRTSVSTLE